MQLGNDTGQPNPAGSRVRVSLGSGAGQGESTRDPGPTHLKSSPQHDRITLQLRPSPSNHDHHPPPTNDGPTKAHNSQRRPEQPTVANDEGGMPDNRAQTTR